MSDIPIWRTRAAALLAPGPVEHADDPAAWVDEHLNEHLWSKQRETALSVVENRRTAVRSGHGTGKSFLASRLVCWWLGTHPQGDAFVVTTAPTGAQVRAILWREIGKAHRKGHLEGRVNQTEWLFGNELVGFGRKPADYTDEAFQGIHARFVLIILDEACGVPQNLWIAANALATNDECRILAIGNPDDPTSYFAKVCAPSSGWNVIGISAYDSPNFTDEWVPADLRPMLVSQVYLDEMESDVGKDTPIWMSKVLGQFPVDAVDGVVLPSQLSACRILEPVPFGQPDGPVELGVDVGGSETGDFTVIRERRGSQLGRTWRMQSGESEKVTEFVLKAILETDAVAVKIDSNGVGWGVAGHLTAKRNAGEHTARIIKVNVGTAASNPKRFPKLRDELWWEVGRKMTETGAWNLSGLDDRTAADLLAPKWSLDPAGRVKIEAKDETKKRIGRSPDDADALLLCYYQGRQSGARTWLETMAPPCRQCGQPNEVGTVNCGRCGSLLAQPDAPDEPVPGPKKWEPWNTPAATTPARTTATLDMLQRMGVRR